MVSGDWVCQCFCVCTFSRYFYCRMACPAGQRQVQNGPSTDDAEGQRRMMEQQQQMQAQIEREQRASSSVPQISFERKSSTAVRTRLLPDPAPGDGPPVKGMEAVCPPRQAQTSQLCTSLASAFSPVQSGGAQSRNARQIPISPPMTPRHQGLKLPPKHRTWSSPHSFSALSSSPPIMAVPLLPLALQPPLRALHTDLASLPPEEHCPSHPGSTSRTLPLKKPEGAFASCCEAVPLPALVGQQAQGPGQQLPFPSLQAQQLYQATHPFNSSPPFYTTQSEGAAPEKTPTLAPDSSPAVPLGHPTVPSVAPPITAPAPASVGGPSPSPPPPLGPPPPSTGTPPHPPPLPSGGGPEGPGEEAPSGLAAALAGAKLRRVQRSEDGSVGASASGAKSDANRSSGTGGGGLMEEMNALLARRRKAAIQTERPGDRKEDDSQNEDPNSPVTRVPGQPNSTDPVKKPWDRANSADKSSLVSRVRPIGSSSDTDALDFDRMKQEILEEVVRELHKVKDEIIDAIRHELSRISTT
ncbi:hypothetical protein SKAU_G00211640 [Synaphobranchus kaupii]|uniref:VASP tetramerisation domain-containing protein n=1 Tax=Synaphobranchus kaupii TaxID=118154 RepID=A0A9Q1IU38_SYNKA|nr:hypothetical protein SKAU_G00211640 [Synaphobranchus kaupii]